MSFDKGEKELESIDNGSPSLASTRTRTPEDHQPPPPVYDPEKHEESATLSDSSNHSDTSSIHNDRVRQQRTVSTGGTRRVLSRTVSEVRDGIQNQRELEEADYHENKGESLHESASDPNLVAWVGVDDPQNPKNWPLKRKWAAVITLSFFTLISPMASSMVAPALTAIGKDLNIPDGFMQALVLSIFIAAYALGPLVWGPLSELYGRVIIMQISNAWFLLFNLGCALARTEGQMIAFRFLSGIGGSAPLAIGGGTLSDLFTAEQRGKALSVYSIMPMLGPAIGPIAGGWIAEKTTWRWGFYSTTIACGVVQTAGFFLLQETYAPVLLHWKRKRLVKETGNKELRTEYDHPERTFTQHLTIALTRPFRLLATQPILQVLALYMAFLYGLMYLMLSSFPALFATKYHESPGIQGLNYISLGLGFWLGSQLCAPLQDRIYARLKKRYVPDGGPGRPEFRVPMMIPGAVIVPVGVLIYAWTAEYKTHWIGPNIGAFIMAVGTIISFQCLQGYIVDAYSRYAASAVGAATVLRSLAGFGFPLFAPAMYAKLGYGPGGSLLAGCAVFIGWPAPILLWVYGQKLRAKSKFTS